MRRSLIPFLTLLFFSSALQGQEIGPIEDFSLAADRAGPLKQLIPGTDNYYYYHCLHYQNNEQYEQVDKLLGAWIKRHKYTPRVREILNRQALLAYDNHPAKSLEYLRQQLGLHFNHHREVRGENPNLPTTLDAKKIRRDVLKARALARHRNLQGFEDSALQWLVSADLSAELRRNLLQRLGRPDHDKLPAMVVADLRYRHSSGFGSMPIHKQLLKTQLDECLKLRPELLNKTHFVNAYLTKLRPNDDVDWRNDPRVYEAYLERIWTFVSRLAPAHNSLKAHVLYHRLVHDRSQGKYDKQRFMTYLALPRRVRYMNTDFMKREASRRWPANLASDFRTFTMLPPVGNDEPLVRSILHHFFVDEKTPKPYEVYLNDLYLKHNFAEAKIVHGLGEPEKWASWLPPAQYQALKKRIDLDFAYTNRKQFSAADAVSLDLDIKHVKSLIVKVYEINADNFYRENGREVDTDINLDGLVANHETTFKYTEPSLRRVRRHFTFPKLEGPGVYVIDFIGNGISSRALVRKGKLSFLVRTSTAGQVFTVLDEANRHVKDASIWMAGHLYRADDEGRITLPYSNRPTRQTIVLRSGPLATLAHFQHQPESYRMVAGIYVDRESLLKGEEATVIVRPSLFLNGTPVTLTVLEEIRLIVTSTDLDGVSTMKEIGDIRLVEDRDYEYTFRTPPRLARLAFTLQAKVQNLSLNKKVDVSAAQDYALNEIDRTDKIVDLHFSRVGDTYFVDVLGKTGEPRVNQAVRFTIKHRDFRNPVTVSLQSNPKGRITLGKLTDIVRVTAQNAQGVSHNWPLSRDRFSYHTTLNGRSGETIRVPYLGTEAKPTRDEFSLLEMRGATFVADRFDALAIKDGMLEIRGLARGDYNLLLKREGVAIRLRIADGKVADRYVLGETRRLELRGTRPLHIVDVSTDEKTITIQLGNATHVSRVHVLATRFVPAYSAYDQFAQVRDAEPYIISTSRQVSSYLAGRNIGDEYRYILDRKLAKIYPGNMLARPTLLLNPWAVRKTETTRQAAAEGQDFSRSHGGRAGLVERGAGSGQATGSHADFCNLDFLPDSTSLLLNLVPDKKGIVSIDRKILGPHQQIRIVAVDPLTTEIRHIALPEAVAAPRDLRLVSGLDIKKHYAQQKQISIVRKGAPFVLGDVASARLEIYDNLPAVYALFRTLNGDAHLAEFSFLLDWHKLDAAAKRAKYSKYACHELNFYLLKKDPKFFATVVGPYLANKKDKTYLDRWLLEQDLGRFLASWDYAQMNIVEQILLGQSVPGERPHTVRHVKDLYDLIPPDLARFNYLFDTAIKGRALDTGDTLGLAKAKDRAESEMLEQRYAQGHRKRPGRSYAGGKGGGLAVPSSPAAPLDLPAAVRAPAKEAKKQLAEKMKLLKSDLRRKANSKNENGLFDDEADGDRAYFARDKSRRRNARQLYVKLDKTKEWAENNYYHLPIEQQNASLVSVNAFWNDYAQHAPGKPFFSTHTAYASRNFTEMMFALALLDLPAKSPEHKTAFEGATMTLTAAGPIIVYHEEIKPIAGDVKETSILVSQNFFRHGDRYRHVDNQRIDKFVRDEFLVHTVYGCQVVVTNPTSSPQKLDLLLQIPDGALPVIGSRSTRSVSIDLQPYHTQTAEYYFYFPDAGKYSHYPVQVTRNESLVAFADPQTFQVVLEPSNIDRDTWDYISQHGTAEQVVVYLKHHNLDRTNLDKIAFRMSDKRFFKTVLILLAARHVYNNTLWSYAIKHGDVPAIRQFLQFADAFVSRCGMAIDSKLLTIDPVLRKTYQHLDYKPLVNARAHQLGQRRQIVNHRFHQQYHRLLTALSYQRTLDDDARMAVTYYLLLQDRVEEALGFFSQVDPAQLKTTLQYDYFQAYLAMYGEDIDKANAIAKRYAKHPVDRWRNAFGEITAQIAEIQGGGAKVLDEEDRRQKQAAAAASSAGLEFEVESRQVTLSYQNVNAVTVRYYLMDIELLFSRKPFVQQHSGQFSYIRPNRVQTFKLPKKKATFQFKLPDELTNSNVLIEISGGGVTRSKAYYSNSLTVQMSENYGQLRVTDRATGKPLPKTYVKVYAQRKDGTVRFYKDGYTDLRGRFDYTSLNTNEIDFVDKFSLLIFHDQHGAEVKEAHPPKR